MSGVEWGRGMAVGWDGARHTARRLPARDPLPPLRSLLLIEIHTISDAARVAGQKFVFPDFGILGRHLSQTLRVAELSDHLRLSQGADAGFEAFYSWLVIAGEKKDGRNQRQENKTPAQPRDSEGKGNHGWGHRCRKQSRRNRMMVSSK